jgi:hypothetical protein
MSPTSVLVCFLHDGSSCTQSQLCQRGLEGYAFEYRIVIQCESNSSREKEGRERGEVDVVVVAMLYADEPFLICWSRSSLTTLPTTL